MEKVCSPYSRVLFHTGRFGTPHPARQEKSLAGGVCISDSGSLLYNYRCDSHMEQLYFHVNIIQVNGMDLFFGCEEVYERRSIRIQYLKGACAFRSSAWGILFFLQGIL